MLPLESIYADLDQLANRNVRAVQRILRTHGIVCIPEVIDQWDRPGNGCRQRVRVTLVHDDDTISATVTGEGTADIAATKNAMVRGVELIFGLRRKGGRHHG